MKKNRKNSGLGAFLNSVSTNASNNENKNSLVRIEIEKIKSNPQNFYGLRDIDKLAEQINLSHIVEPLMVIKNPNSDEDGMQYLLIAGHRRRAAWQKLLDTGKVTDHTLPCIILEFEPMVLKSEDGTEKVITIDRIANMYLMLSNMGQREVRTVSERLQEVKQLEPIARDIYDSLPTGKRGNFRTYFAEEFLSIPESNLQRLLSMAKLSEKAKEYVDNGKISFVFGAKLSTFTPEEQDEYLEEIDNGIRKGTVRELVEYKKSLNEDNSTTSTEEPAGESAETSTDTDTAEESHEETKEPAEEENEEETDSVPEDDDTPPAPPTVPDDEEEDNEEAVTKPQQEEPAPKALSSANNNGMIEIQIEDLPSNLTSPDFQGKKEASLWAIKAEIAGLEAHRSHCKAMAERYEDVDEAKCGQWTLRHGEVISRLAILRKLIQ